MRLMVATEPEALEVENMLDEAINMEWVRSEEGSREEEMHVVQVGAGLCDVLERVGTLADIMGVVGVGNVRQHLGGRLVVSRLRLGSSVPFHSLVEPRSGGLR